MKVWFFSVSEEVTQTNLGDQLKNNIVNPLSFIGIPFVPALFSFGISCGIYRNVSEEGELRIHFIHSDEDEQDIKDQMIIGPFNLSTIPIDQSLPAELQGFLLNSNLRNVVIRKTGKYNIKIMHNNDVVELRTIDVIAKG